MYLLGMEMGMGVNIFYTFLLPGKDKLSISYFGKCKIQSC